MGAHGEGQARASGLREDAQHLCLHTRPSERKVLWLSGRAPPGSITATETGDLHPWGGRVLGPEAVAPTPSWKRQRSKNRPPNWAECTLLNFPYTGVINISMPPPSAEPNQETSFWLRDVWKLSSPPGIEPGPPALEAQSLTLHCQGRPSGLWK